MRFSGGDAILFNLRLIHDPVPIHRPFGDPGASVVQIGPKLRFWALVCGCSVLRMMYISQASTEILCAGDLPAHFDMLLPRETNPESLRLIFVLSERSKMKRKSIEKTPRHVRIGCYAP